MSVFKENLGMHFIYIFLIQYLSVVKNNVDDGLPKKKINGFY
jgi:hypothetical protein